MDGGSATSGPWKLGSTTNELDRPFHAILEPLWKGPKILAFLAALKVAEFWHLQFLLLQVQHEAWLRGHFCDADFSDPITDSRGLKPNLAQKTSAASPLWRGVGGWGDLGTSAG